MAMMTAYFDESGTHGASEIITVAGYVASVEQWKKFVEPWAQSLKEVGVDYFHMTDVENMQGQFRGWDKEKQIDFIKKHINIINSYTKFSVASSVVVKDYEELRAEGKSELSPYAYCFAQCFERINSWMRGTKYQGAMSYILEKGGKGAGDVLNLNQYMEDPHLLNEYRKSPIAFLEKQTTLQLQAADFITYEAWKDFTNLYQNSGRDERISFTRSLPILHYSFRYGKGLIDMHYEQRKRAAAKRAAPK